MDLASLIFLLTAFSIAIPFLITMNLCLDQIRPENRYISRWQLWLNLLPVFNIFWTFITARRFSRSIDAEIRSRHGTTSAQHAVLGLITAGLFAGFMLSLPLSSWNWLMFATWILALGLYWRAFILQMMWLMTNAAP